MLVYGDAATTAPTAARLDRIARTLREARAAPSPERRDLRMRAFLDAAGLAQGLVDAEFAIRGRDDLTILHAEALALTLALARLVADQEDDPERAITALRALPLPAEVRVKAPEGHAYYAVYPEAYFAAARAEAWPTPPFVIGLRSIGTGLAAMVAAATGAADVVTLRPGGPPFARQVRVSPALRARLAAHAGPFAIADEGPGLSGSSFGCVADLLEELGVGLDRMVFFPSHAGAPGPEASAAHRARWAAARRRVVTLDELAGAAGVAAWFADLIGEPRAVDDLSGGAWRAALGLPAPANPGQERRKFRIVTDRGRYIARFAGLGEAGEAKLARARALFAEGFGPEPLALRRGFLLQAWIDGAPLDPGGAERPRFLAWLARYLAFRARAFPAAPDAGASPAELAEMARVNAGLALSPPPLGPRVHVDGKLQPWEWRVLADGRFCKLDALDHAAGHDLVGAQPAAWDVAGACVEFALSPAERDALIAAVPGTTPESVNFLEACHLAFQLGVWTLAGDAPGAADERARYAGRLAAYGS